MDLLSCFHQFKHHVCMSKYTHFSLLFVSVECWQFISRLLFIDARKTIAISHHQHYFPLFEIFSTICLQLCVVRTSSKKKINFVENVKKHHHYNDIIQQQTTWKYIFKIVITINIFASTKRAHKKHRES